MNEQVMALLAKLGMQPRGGAEQGALFDALGDRERSAVTQLTSGAKKRMPDLPQVMMDLQRRMPPEQYKAMMEDRSMVNTDPTAQLMELLGARQAPRGR